MDGRSLVPLLENPEAAWDHPAFTIWSEDGRTATGISVRVAGWRYTEYTGPRGGAVLFDETADPHEMTNLADDPQFANERARLSKFIEEFQRSRSTPGGARG
jgi:iduronate 2-sulfatase